MKRFARQSLWWATSILIIKLSGCATTGTTTPSDVTTGNRTSDTPSTTIQEPRSSAEEPARSATVPPPEYTDAQTTTHPAVLALLSEATQQETSGDPEVAAAKLERALRIEPRNALLWHHLAAVRLRQGQTQLAVSLAQKSNSFAARDSELVERNQRIIQLARGRN